ncbi:MAG: DUF3987 domain-containing protein, partial [Halioglobus sp.]|nr:DUF3987 domain-containing protein [Halioglobus sp.]
MAVSAEGAGMTQAAVDDCYPACDAAPLCSGYGQYHSPSNETNPQPYVYITLAEIRARLTAPQEVEKESAQWVIFSTLPSRVHKEQGGQGEFYALWADLDDPEGLTLADTVSRAVEAVPGEVWAYTSRSATGQCQKSRLIIPLAVPVIGNDFVRLQKALNRRLVAVGLRPDLAAERAGQVCYLPNRGEYYSHFLHESLESLEPFAFADDLAEIEREEQAAQQARKAAQEAARQNACQRMASGVESPVDAFNAAYDLPLMLDTFGYIKKGSRWLSPNSASRTPGVSLTQDGRKWLSAHGSDAGIGRTTRNGTMGDAFDLFVYWEHGGDYEAAVQSAGAMFTTTKGLTITRSNQRAYRQTGAPDAAVPDASPAVVVDPFGGLTLPPFPVELLPEVIGRFARDQAELIGLDPGIIGMAALGAAAACIDDRQELQPKRHDPTWTESARLWLGIIGGPSTKKSPGIQKAMGPLFKVDSAWRRETQRAMAEWQERCDGLKKGEPLPEPPIQKRLIVSDATVEKLGDILSKGEPRGILSYQDELSGWLQGMDAYKNGGGKDRAAWLEAYNGGPRSIDRVGRGSTFVENWSACVVGGIQPEVVQAYAKTTNHDGMLQRFLLVQAGEAREGVDRSPDMAAKEAYSALMEHLAALVPWGVVTLSEDAHKAREALDAKLIKATRSSGNKFLAAALGKWNGTFARLLLTFHCIEMASAKIHPAEVPVSGDTATRVANLLWQALLPHAVLFYQGLDPTEDRGRDLAALILARGWERFTVKRDLMQNMRAARNWRPWELDEALDRLDGYGWLTPEPGKLNERGRPAA